MRPLRMVLAAAALSPLPANALSVYSSAVEQTGDFLSIAGFPAGVDAADIVVRADYKADDLIIWFGDAGIGDTAYYNYSRFEFRVIDVASGRRAVFVAEPTDVTYEGSWSLGGVVLNDGQCGGDTLGTNVRMYAVPTPLDLGGGVTLERMTITARGECDTINWDPSDEVDFSPYDEVDLSITISDALGREGTLSGPRTAPVPLPAPLALALVPATVLLLLRRRRSGPAG